VNLDHLFGADGVCGIHLGTVLGPLFAALTAMEDAGVGTRAVEINDRLGAAPTARTPLLHRTYPLKAETA
jgi:hypothetical protein